MARQSLGAILLGWHAGAARHWFQPRSMKKQRLHSWSGEERCQLSRTERWPRRSNAAFALLGKVSPESEGRLAPFPVSPTLLGCLSSAPFPLGQNVLELKSQHLQGGNVASVGKQVTRTEHMFLLQFSSSYFTGPETD